MLRDQGGANKWHGSETSCHVAGQRDNALRELVYGLTVAAFSTCNLFQTGLCSHQQT